MSVANDFDFLSLNTTSRATFVDFDISINHHKLDQSLFWRCQALVPILAPSRVRSRLFMP
jgi:hypothetical protein